MYSLSHLTLQLPSDTIVTIPSFHLEQLHILENPIEMRFSNHELGYWQKSSAQIVLSKNESTFTIWFFQILAQNVLPNQKNLQILYSPTKKIDLILADVLYNLK